MFNPIRNMCQCFEYSMRNNVRDVTVDVRNPNAQVNFRIDGVRQLKICGYVCDCCNRPVAGAIVTLYPMPGCGCNASEELCCTHTGGNGYYEFVLPAQCGGRFKVVVTLYKDRYDGCCTGCDREDRYCFEECFAGGPSNSCHSDRNVPCGGRTPFGFDGMFLR